MKQFRTIETLFEPSHLDTIEYWSGEELRNLDWFGDIVLAALIMVAFLMMFVAFTPNKSVLIADHDIYSASDLNANSYNKNQQSVVSKEGYTALFRHKPTDLEYALWTACLENGSQLACDQFDLMLQTRNEEMERR